MMLRIQMPAEAANAAIKDGRFAKVMSETMERLKPEAAYFTEYHGQRSGILIVDLKHASEIPKFAEPWFLQFNAKVELHPAMVAADLAASGIEALGKTWG